MKRTYIFALTFCALLGFYFLNPWSTAQSVEVTEDKNSNGVSDLVDQFIEGQGKLSPDRKKALSRYARYLQAILNSKGSLPFDEKHELACISELSKPFDSEYDDLELMVKGKILNSPAKIKKYYQHGEQFSGQVHNMPEVTHDECLR